MVYTQHPPLASRVALLRAALFFILVLGLVPAFTSSGALAQGQPSSTASAVVNINTADAKALAAGLKGIGESRAADIVRYRETYGPFTSVEELAEVKGVGKSTIDKNRHLMTLE